MGTHLIEHHATNPIIPSTTDLTLITERIPFTLRSQRRTANIGTFIVIISRFEEARARDDSSFWKCLGRAQKKHFVNRETRIVNLMVVKTTVCSYMSSMVGYKENKIDEFIFVGGIISKKRRIPLWKKEFFSSTKGSNPGRRNYRDSSFNFIKSTSTSKLAKLEVNNPQKLLAQSNEPFPFDVCSQQFTFPAGKWSLQSSENAFRPTTIALGEVDSTPFPSLPRFGFYQMQLSSHDCNLTKRTTVNFSHPHP